MDADPDLAGTRLRDIDVDEPQYVARTQGFVYDCPHEQILSSGVAQPRGDAVDGQQQGSLQLRIVLFIFGCRPQSTQQ